MISRRKILAGAVGAATLSSSLLAARELRQPKERVLTLSCASYQEDLVGLLKEAILGFPRALARIKNGTVLLKPNLVEVHTDRPINTDPQLIVAAIEAIRQLGARKVVVGEGPGHVRDSDAILWNSGLGELLKQAGAPYIDLNVDQTEELLLPMNYTGQKVLPIARSVLEADLVVSMPKLKTHHWAGITLSMKNLFGTVPGVAVGWPKNRLHWIGLDASIGDLWSGLQPGLAIVDGIVGMEGDGPIMGDAVKMGIVVVGESCPAVDASCARLMQLNPEKIRSLRLARAAGGTISALRIEQAGDKVAPRVFKLMPDWERKLRG
jgi:uncharacterized protein (DUF362 family)